MKQLFFFFYLDSANFLLCCFRLLTGKNISSQKDAVEVVDPAFLNYILFLSRSFWFITELFLPYYVLFCRWWTFYTLWAQTQSLLLPLIFPPDWETASLSHWVASVMVGGTWYYIVCVYKHMKKLQWLTKVLTPFELLHSLQGNSLRKMFHSFQNVLLMNVWEVWLRFDLERLTAHYISIIFGHLETQILLCKLIRKADSKQRHTPIFRFLFFKQCRTNKIFFFYVDQHIFTNLKEIPPKYSHLDICHKNCKNIHQSLWLRCGK